jgi:hypothetical protein
MIFDVYDIYWVIWVVPLGAPLPGFIYATGQEFTRVLVEYGLEPSFFYSKLTFESLFLSSSLMGRTRYINPWVPKGHTLVSSPRDSIRVADSGWVSKTSNLWLQFFDFLKSLISSIFDFSSLTSSNFDFLKSLGSWILRSRWEWNIESMSLVFTTDNGLEFFFLALLEVILHRVRDQRSRWE